MRKVKTALFPLLWRWTLPFTLHPLLLLTLQFSLYANHPKSTQQHQNLLLALGMSSIASLLVAGDEILANAEDPQAERDDANSHSESTPQHQDSPPTLAMPSDHSFVVAGEETPTNSEVHEVTRRLFTSRTTANKRKDPPLPATGGSF
jgi:hypothetical protein